MSTTHMSSDHDAEWRARMAGLAADTEARQREVWLLLPPSTRPYHCWICGRRLNHSNGSGFCGTGCSSRAGETAERGAR